MHPRLLSANFATVSTSTAEPKDVVALWKRVSAKLQTMTPDERADSLVRAGILTKKGSVAKRYKNVIVPIKSEASVRVR